MGYSKAEEVKDSPKEESQGTSSREYPDNVACKYGVCVVQVNKKGKPITRINKTLAEIFSTSL